ncbi:hypothetical protein [Sphingopyxis sp.]|uniref:hypothetical protein n=1 Tax=Sphingopyxis sp. TaxID=1908224 RepID=UPI0026328C84|nr:hypothetical protein [Sphingopyxis sp.]MCW0196811.1 hypothetical protein [Sphingopyxis sp.]
MRARLRADPYLPKGLDFLRSTELRAIAEAIGGVEQRSLVDLRYHLASAFAQHVRDVAGDRLKPNRSERRKALRSLQAKAAALRVAAEENMPWLRSEHYEAKFFGATGPDWSPFEYDYVALVQPVERLEAIAASILSVPPIGNGTATSPFLAGFPSDRLENPGTGVQFAFARRLAQIYFDLTGKTPGVTKEQPGPYQRMVAAASDAFRNAYKAAESPFGEWRAPSREVMQKACKSIGRK